MENEKINEQIKKEEIEKRNKDIIIRLRKIQGQVKGIEKMVSSETCCRNILVQVAAVRSAVNKVGGLILEHYSTTCLDIKDKETDDGVKELIDTFMMFLK
ncbi:metal-sensitive transcriptional regulator [Oceanirhabdus sp. W0125-5]|uniref:metal-sensitive transcriptional regulator n=1 Tax=Oceanirhabdus sp. W0125-5 TaxID=2999116 RepID=UPI0022F33276|nr:metal-sensitive transcriptional regulator [Oceanirhabdus sp. W0125-5]WBW99543.1 metal-sensitive transcriptional regulator [Oceanirhabdus sp. W0125-5]